MEKAVTFVIEKNFSVITKGLMLRCLVFNLSSNGHLSAALNH